jgi:hypothetical protein
MGYAMGWSHAFEEFLAQPALINEHLGEFEDEIRRMVAAEHDIVDQASLLGERSIPYS